jgi:hypothetical protein
VKKLLFGVAILVLIGAAIGSGSDKATSSKPAFTSSGNCKTTPTGEFRCEHSAAFGKTTTSSQMRCRTNPATDRTECNMAWRAIQHAQAVIRTLIRCLDGLRVVRCAPCPRP